MSAMEQLATLTTCTQQLLMHAREDPESHESSDVSPTLPFTVPEATTSPSYLATEGSSQMHFQQQRATGLSSRDAPIARIASTAALNRVGTFVLKFLERWINPYPPQASSCPCWQVPAGMDAMDSRPHATLQNGSSRFAPAVTATSVSNPVLFQISSPEGLPQDRGQQLLGRQLSTKFLPQVPRYPIINIFELSCRDEIWRLLLLCANPSSHLRGTEHV